MKELDAIEQAEAGRALGDGLANVLAIPGATRDQKSYPQQDLRETWWRVERALNEAGFTIARKP